MPHIACYQLLTDDLALSLPNDFPGAEESRDVQKVHWNPVHDADLALDRSRRPILCYRVDCQDAAGVQLRVQLRDRNGADRTISTQAFAGNTVGHVMDPFPVHWVSDGNNKIFFRRLAGRGKVLIRHVMVLYQRLVS